MIMVRHKTDDKVFDVYDIAYQSKTGKPIFLIYDDGQWLRKSAKYFVPYKSTVCWDFQSEE